MSLDDRDAKREGIARELQWEEALRPWLSGQGESCRVFVRAGTWVDLRCVEWLNQAEVFLEPAVEDDGWLSKDVEPREPGAPLQAMVFLGNTGKRDILTVFGRGFRWLAPGGRLLLLDRFAESRRQHGEDGFLTFDHVLSLAKRAGFSLEASVDVSSHGLLSPGGDAMEFPARLLVYRRLDTTGRWRVTYQEPLFFHDVQKLFGEVFGHEMSHALWDWKYGHGRGQGVLALRDDDVVAHYGGLTRRIRYRGRQELAVQVADVMVHPKERGMLTRRGAFYQAAASFPEMCTGFGSKHLIGFGFPNRRHHRLAERLGIYREVERIVQLQWPALAGNGKDWLLQDLSALPKWRVSRLVDRLWRRMASDLLDSIVGERDMEWLRYRYLDHPEHRYKLVLVRTRRLRRVLGIAVLREHDVGMELMDLVGSLRALPEVVRAVRYFTATAGQRDLFCWITSGYARRLGVDEATWADPDICVPTSIQTAGPEASEIRGRWWLMSGDTDFR